MRLLVEDITETKLVHEISEAISENGGTPMKQYWLTGIFLQADMRNGNNRIYPKAILDEAVDVYRQKYIALGRGYGELGHPDPNDPGIHLNNVAILTQDIKEDGNNFIGKAKVIDTPAGRIVKAFIDEGVTLGVSSRGRGDVKNGIVQKGFRLVTAVDVVADPSAPDAFASALVEGKDWVVENGIMLDEEVSSLRLELLATNRKNLVAKKMELLQKFLGKIST
jgi:hypothetical protein